MTTRGWMLSLMLSAASIAPALAQGPVTPSGGGTEGDPYRISQLGHLVWMGQNVGSSSGKHYTMQTNIDASATAAWNGGAGFVPIGSNSATGFRGSFDGKGWTINGLTINRTNLENVGLFGYVSDDGLVRDARLADASIMGGWARGTNTNVGTVGILAGDNHGTVSNCHSTGSVKVGANTDVCAGGLVGGSFGIVFDSSSRATVAGHDFVGAFVGWNFGSLRGCVASGSVTGSWAVGGLAGDNFSGSVSNCHTTASVTGDSSVGGLIGYNSWRSSTVNGCSATGPVTGYSDVGGLVGQLWGGSISRCYATGTVTGTGGPGVGGLAGWNTGSISECYATAQVAGTLGSAIGGLVGQNDWDGVVSMCYAAGAVAGDSSVGGLVGWNGGYPMGDSFWDTQTTGQSASAGGTGKTPTQMKQQATFAGWDFVSVWRVRENVTYPYFALPPRLDAPVGVGAATVLRWCSVSNHVYALHRSTNLLSGFSVVKGGIAATPPTNTYTDNVSAASVKFWRVSTED